MAERDVHAEHEEHEESGHSVPVPVYLKVFAALMVLLVATLIAASYDLGSWNILIAVTIAVVKAALVVLFFMHLYYSSQIVKIFAGAGLVWLTILFFFAASDYISRGWLPTPGR